MRFGVATLGLIIIEFLLYLFGYINSNSIIAVMLGTGSFKDLFSLGGLLNVQNMILSATTVVGIVQKNSYIIFGSLTLFLLDSVFGLSGIIGIFPEPFGHILFGLISFVFTWLAVEWWRVNDN